MTRLMRPMRNSLRSSRRVASGAAPEVLVHRVAQQRGASAVHGCAQVHDQRQRRVGRRLARPVDDVVAGLRVEVALAKRRRVHRVEQLPQLAEVQLEHRTGASRGARASVPELGAQPRIDCSGRLGRRRRRDGVFSLPNTAT